MASVPERGGEAEIGIAYRDEHLLVLIKPPRLPTTSPDGLNCLAAMARALDPSAPKMHPSSRLDRDVTGLVIFARTERAIEMLLQARRDGRYERAYLALVAGVPDPERGTWHWSIAIDPADPRRRIAVEEGSPAARAQQASSDYALRASARGFSVLALAPRSGRTHQLRVHCARAGHPILGDVAYGGAPRVVLQDGRVVAARRPHLHCARVCVPHPRGGRERLELVAPVPDDLARSWTSMGGDRGALSG
jgi:23S rRNA pseudouridine955/2504/2580 synthase